MSGQSTSIAQSAFELTDPGGCAAGPSPILADTANATEPAHLACRCRSPHCARPWSGVVRRLTPKRNSGRTSDRSHLHASDGSGGDAPLHAARSIETPSCDIEESSAPTDPASVAPATNSGPWGGESAT